LGAFITTLQPLVMISMLITNSVLYLSTDITFFFQGLPNI